MRFFARRRGFRMIRYVPHVVPAHRAAGTHREPVRDTRLMKDVATVAKTRPLCHALLADCTVSVRNDDIVFQCVGDLLLCGRYADVLHWILPVLFKRYVYHEASVRGAKNDSKDTEDIMSHAITVRQHSCSLSWWKD
jgi:hypothetical protein